MAVLRLTALALAACIAAGTALADPAEPATAGPAPAAMSPAPAAMSPAPDMPSRELPRLEDRRRVALPPMVIPQEPAAADRRPMYVGAGLIVMAAVLWWNRRRRDRFEREDGRPVRARRERRPTRDADADDLHAAARGDAPESNDAPDPRDPPERPTPS